MSEPKWPGRSEGWDRLDRAWVEGYGTEPGYISREGPKQGGHRARLCVNGISWAQVYSFGCNDEGALGRDTSVEGSEMVPGKVELQEKVVQVSAGDSHTAALTEDGRVFLWGSFRVRLGLAGSTFLSPLCL